MREPKRIQRRRTKGWRMPGEAIYVGRSSRWGNPYKVVELPGGWLGLERRDRIGAMILEARFRDKQTAKKRAVELFENYAQQRLAADPHWLDPLRGNDLACWCPLDEPCHADILLKMANK